MSHCSPSLVVLHPQARPRGRLARAVAVLFVCQAAAVQACTMSETQTMLGTVTSQQVQGGSAITGSGSFAYTCGPVVLSVLAGTPTMRATLQPSLQGLTLKNGIHSIPYQVYSSPSLSTAYAGGAVIINLAGSTVLTLLGGGAGAHVPIYVATTPGANVPAGTYTDTLQLSWVTRNICEGLVNLAGLCLGILNNHTETRTLQVSMTVTNDCTITAPAVSFGSAPLVSGFPSVAQSIALLCTKGMSYSVGLSPGSHAQAGRRQMASGANRLAYDIFKVDNTVWGHLSSARASGPAPSDGISLQTIPYTARIYQDQPTPPAAVYTDNVVVDVSF